MCVPAALQFSKTCDPPIEWAEKGENDAGRVPLNVSVDNFPLNTVAKRMTQLAEELENGAGAVMISNMCANNVPSNSGGALSQPMPDFPSLLRGPKLIPRPCCFLLLASCACLVCLLPRARRPVDKYTIDELGVMYLGMSAHMGHLVLQSSSGLRSKSRGFGMPLGFIRAEMTGKTPLNGKQANNYFRLHTDRCDVISLLSIRCASQGGHARVASAVAIHDTMLERAPHLVPKLYQPIERIWEGGTGVIALPVWDQLKDGRFTTQISPSYIENAQYVDGVKKVRACRRGSSTARPTRTPPRTWGAPPSSARLLAACHICTHLTLRSLCFLGHLAAAPSLSLRVPARLAA